MRYAIIACALALGACSGPAVSGPAVITMTNPATGEVRQCGGTNGGAKDCADAYAKQGWVRLN